MSIYAGSCYKPTVMWSITFGFCRIYDRQFSYNQATIVCQGKTKSVVMARRSERVISRHHFRMESISSFKKKTSNFHVHKVISLSFFFINGKENYHRLLILILKKGNILYETTSSSWTTYRASSLGSGGQRVRVLAGACRLALHERIFYGCHFSNHNMCCDLRPRLANKHACMHICSFPLL